MNDLRFRVQKTKEGLKSALDSIEEIEKQLVDDFEEEDRSNETLTLKELAEILRIHYSTIRRYVKEGKITVKKLGGRYFFLKGDLPALMKKLETEGLN